MGVFSEWEWEWGALGLKKICGEFTISEAICWQTVGTLSFRGGGGDCLFSPFSVILVAKGHYVNLPQLKATPNYKQPHNDKQPLEIFHSTPIYKQPLQWREGESMAPEENLRVGFEKK